MQLHLDYLRISSDLPTEQLFRTLIQVSMYLQNLPKSHSKTVEPTTKYTKQQFLSLRVDIVLVKLCKKHPIFVDFAKPSQNLNTKTIRNECNYFAMIT